MARYGRILLLAALAGMLVAGFEGGPGRSAGNHAARGTAIAAEAGGSSTTGVTVTRPVPSVRESLSDVQARSLFLQEPSTRDRHIRFRRIPRSADTTTFSPQLSLSLSPAAPVSAAPAPMAPALDAPFPNGFTGIGNPNPLTQGDVIPPDTMGAAGPAHLVSLLNSQFGVFNKSTGVVIPPVVSLRGFWSSLDPATDNASRFVFDPKILYDTNSQRFVAVTLSADNGPPSWVMIAMSAPSNPPGDPTGIWYKVAIRADLNADGTDNTFWADYPGLGVDMNNIYISANMFNSAGSFGHSKVWVVSKSEPLLNGGTDNLAWTEFRAPQGSRDSMQPAHTFGQAPAEYFIYEGENQLFLARMDNTADTPVWNRPLPLTGVSGVASFVSDDSLPVVPQAGNPNGIDASDTRLLNAVYRNGSLWTTHHVAVPPIIGKIEVRWYQIDPAPVNGIVQSQGQISDPNRGYFYPSITVNNNSDVAIGFSGSSAAQYASAYYTARRSNDPTGVMPPPSLLKTGEAPYLKTGATFGGTETDNRWGDFSATVVDPTDGVTFWTLQEYAATPMMVNGTLRSMWGTWWGKFRPPAIASPFISATVISTTQVDLAWTIQAGQGQTGFRVERRQLPGGDFGTITVPDLGPGEFVYTDNTGTAGTTFSYRIRALSPAPGPDSYSNEATAVTVSLPPPAAPAGGGGGGGCGISHEKIQEGDVSPLTTVLIILFPASIIVIRRHLMRSSR